MMTPERLRELYDDARPAAIQKVIDHVDIHVRQFLEACPYAILATTNGASMDISPKGDPKGFIAVEDEHHIILPDRPGNNRLDGMLNILAHPQVALLLIIPNVRETLRINGIATIVDDEETCAAHALNGRVPKTVLRIRVQEVMTHCGKAAMRSGLWDPSSWPTERPVANQSEMLRDHTQTDMEILSETEIERRYREML
ncbi:MAG: MSMEG_1061 family FMN-dependent PPOX-type flavoprotein [Pseudomonadota bacterium]